MMRMFKGLTLGIFSVILITLPAKAAEVLLVPVGKVNLSISRETLQTYVKDGTINEKESLATYLQWLSPQEREEFRKILQSRYSFDAVAVEQFINSPMVAAFLIYVGRMIQTESGSNGAQAIRTTLVNVTASPNGFTILDAMREFPSEGIQINLQQVMSLLSRITGLIQKTNDAIALVENVARSEANASPAVDFQKMPDLREAGNLSSTKETIVINSSQENRQFEVDLYRPELDHLSEPNLTNQNLSQGITVPVLVISHGLASHRSRYENLARHLASYGFVVAVPQHSGSDVKQLQALLKGEVSDLFEPEQFVNRPHDITDLLNQLEILNSTQFNHQLNLSQVGVIGHSLGGYTALALGGAILDFKQLQQDCSVEDKAVVNPSLLLQCRALELPKQEYTLQDKRVKALLVLNPIDSSIFGRNGLSRLEIPVMMAASSVDLLAPALLEQIKPFTWLKTKNKYLIVKDGDWHFYDVTDEVAKKLAGIWQTNSAINRGYINALSVAFFKTYIANQNEYQPYLQATYAQAISQEPYTLSVVQTLQETLLNQAVNGILDNNP